jgi:hypothetical protein
MATYTKAFLGPRQFRKQFREEKGGYVFRASEKTYFLSPAERDAFVASFERSFDRAGKAAMAWCAIGIAWYAAVRFGLTDMAMPALPGSNPGQTFMLGLALPFLYIFRIFGAPGRALERSHVPIASISDDAATLQRLQRITTVDFLLIAAVSCSIPTTVADYFGVVPGSFTSQVLWGVPIAVLLVGTVWTVRRRIVARRVRKAAGS